MKESPKKDFYLYGLHPVSMAWANKRRKIKEILTCKDTAELKIPKSIPVRKVSREQIDSLVGKDTVHQGIIAKVAPLEPTYIEDIIATDKNADTSLIVILDQVTDPHNIGAILRSAAAFNVAAVVLPDAGAPEESGALAKSASGALEIVPLIRITNLARTMEQLKKADYWCVGMDGTAKKSIVEQKLPARCALVMGSEGEGMRRLTVETCDYLTKLPMNTRIESLNVSNACAIALYEWNRLYKIQAV